ncbi:MAG TPA: acyl-ACP--UDP-N-acetylglucosamine O-acyltransferase [Phycisphaerae bacterium]|nr:acyl-ACP--UDP-N-acetylglucosamine O-acyltransferase [Phycisphaerae bacterium]
MIHPTAIIDPAAKIDPTVNIGPYCAIEGPVQIGPDCVLHSHVKLIGPLQMGAKNVMHSFAVLGDIPQDVKFHEGNSRLIIGDSNVFREHVTVHRGTEGETVIGSNCYLMVGAHVGHNCRLGNNITMVNAAVLAGHVQIADRAIIGGLCAVHQYCRIGRLVMISNNSAHNVDIPPFVMSLNTNSITQLNNVGLRRSGMSHKSINALRLMFKILFREHGDLPLNKAIEILPNDLKEVPEVAEFIAFVQSTKRGIARYVPWSEQLGRKSGSDGEEE